jgi:aspartyl-tRNA(Asn)/glutamyl-tRNA(Gln) amidotransferase subunit C
MKLSHAQVVHVANLAQLDLTEDEVELFQEQLSSILEYAERLQAVDTDQISPTATVLPLENVLREDRVHPSLPVELVLTNAPADEDDCFRVPVILEDQA